jgi:hypothetical protein
VISESLFPQREAIKLTQLWRAAHGLTFPIRAGALAQEWSRNVAPKEPIGAVTAQDLKGFEGGLFWLPNRSEWALLYRPHANLPGRTNFTIAHEFGHYVLHRKLRNVFECSQSDTLGGTKAKIEREADQFASFLLMPIDDFRVQVGRKRISLDLLSDCASRYEVSMTAAILKWLSFTEKAAVLITARDGMVLWFRPSDRAKAMAYAHLHEGMELPHRSVALATNWTSMQEMRHGTELPAGVWFPEISVREMVIVSDRYDMTVSLLMLDVPGAVQPDEPESDMLTTPPTF